MKKVVLLTVGIVVVAELIVGMAWVYSGTVDVSAVRPEGNLTRWFLASVKDQSIRSRASAITVPSLEDSLLIVKGFDHYNEMCASCHGGPGRDAEELAKGLNPSAPLLAQAAGKRTAAEMFVIIKEGIRMTGMPAWGTTHDDSAIWSMVAFVQRLPSMTPEKYNEFERPKHGGEETEQQHDHHELHH